MRLDVTLVLPTYNERDNLAPLLEAVTKGLEPYEYQILVVDDDSPDRTWEEAERLRACYPRLQVIRRLGEKGLASAVVRGFREAQGSIVAVMDADLQHDAKILENLIALLDGADFAVASRAGVNAGAFRRDRRVRSSIANALARVVLDVPLSDPMSGYFAMRRELFERLDGSDLRPRGFKILLYLYARAVDRFGARNIRVREIPFVFRSRLHGESKLTNHVAWEYLRMLIELRRGSKIPKSFVKFACVGVLGVIVNNAALALLHYWVGLHYLVADVVAVELAIVHNYVLNERWTFSHHRNSTDSVWVSRFAKFQVVSLVGMGINLGILALLKGLLGLPLVPSNVVGITAAALYNYGANTLWTWRLAVRAPSRCPPHCDHDIRRLPTGGRSAP